LFCPEVVSEVAELMVMVTCVSGGHSVFYSNTFGVCLLYLG
jgi:hypothetical protein